MVCVPWNWISFSLDLALTTVVLASTAWALQRWMKHLTTQVHLSLALLGAAVPSSHLPSCQGLTVCPSAGPSVLSVVRSGDETRVFSTVDHTEVGWCLGTT